MTTCCELVYSKSITNTHELHAPHLYTAKHQVQKLNSVSKCIVTKIAEDVEKAEVGDGGVALCCSDHFTSTITAGRLH